MHIPDGFLDIKTWVTLSVTSAGVLGLSIKKTKKIIGEKHIPMMGVMAAFIFTAQMLNFPVPGGTSGHFLGGVLIAILLGPFTGVLIMATVIILQCFIFQDGGLTALGANIFNMGVIGSMAGYHLYLGLNMIIHNTKWKFVNVFLASWLTVILAASSCAIELAISGTVPIRVALTTMASVHALIGIGEGIITVLVLGFIFKARPDLLKIEKI